MGRPLSQNLAGLRFGQLDVIRQLEVSPFPGQAAWICKCDCGCTFVTTGGQLKRGSVKSCGCLRRKMLHAGMQRTHGMSKTALYRVWAGMINRCHNSNQPHYERYGGRGIFVCDEWRNSFEAFFNDMGERPTGPTGKPYTIERIDNDGPYCKENCKWIPHTMQSRNQRKRRKRTE